MSRIHEALKKAAEERSAQISAASGPAFVNIAADVHRTPGNTAELPGEAIRGVAAPKGVGFLRFEELVKRCARPKWLINPQSSVFLNTDNGRYGAERFRTLRSRLYQIAGVRPLRRVLVTSSVPQEGKTFVATNLAQSIVRQPDQRVLLIDADLRASHLHLTLGAPNTPGLTDYLRGEADEYAIIQNGLEGNLCFIPGGNEVANPSELLLNERMIKLLELVTPMFDWVILDSPPALPVHDASMLADMCDGVLFVVRAGSTSFESAEKAAVEFRHKNLLGVVLNRVEKDASYGAYYYNYPAEKEKDRT
jgi:protein-tyrosine kinase